MDDLAIQEVCSNCLTLNPTADPYSIPHRIVETVDEDDHFRTDDTDTWHAANRYAAMLLFTRLLHPAARIEQDAG